MRKDNEEAYQKRIVQYKSEIKAKDKLLSSIHRISSLLTRPVSLNKVLTTITEETAIVFGFTRVDISLVNEKNPNLLECKYVMGFNPEERERALGNPLRLDKHDCVETRTVKTGKAIYLKDYRTDKRLTEIDFKLCKIYKRVSGIAAPLKTKRKVIGFIGGDITSKKLDLTRNEIKLFSTFANQASIVIENARLYEQIITEKNFAENILESSPNGVMMVDCSRRVSLVNRKAEEILCLKRDEIIGKSVSDVFEKYISEMIDSALNNRKAIENREIERIGKNGNAVTLGISSSFLKSHDKNVAGIIIIIQNLTELKKTEELLRRMDRLSSLGQLSAGIAHEIRNPLASINFNVQMLSKKLDMDDKTRSIVSDTIEGINRLKRLVKGMLDFTKPGIPSLKSGVINDVIRDSIALIDAQIKKRNIYLETELGKDLPETVFDPVQMQQVFVNLLLNAAEAVHEGGIINVKSMMGNNNFNGMEKQLLVYITDNGPGISPENLSKVFDPFFTTKPEGTGLGLSITCKILEQHNAFIDILSEENRGATFVLRFPVVTNLHAQ